MNIKIQYPINTVQHIIIYEQHYDHKKSYPAVIFAIDAIRVPYQVWMMDLQSLLFLMKKMM